MVEVANAGVRRPKEEARKAVFGDFVSASIQDVLFTTTIVTVIILMYACIIPRELCVPVKHMHEQLIALFSYFLNGPRNEADTMLAHSSSVMAATYTVYCDL